MPNTEERIILLRVIKLPAGNDHLIYPLKKGEVVKLLDIYKAPGFKPKNRFLSIYRFKIGVTEVYEKYNFQVINKDKQNLLK